MSGHTLAEQLQQLHDLILRERECAKALDLDGLRAVTREKEELVRRLEPAVDRGPELRALAEKIKLENRRNAYLFWSSLKFVRDSMSFFTRQVSPPAAYGAGGRMIESSGSGLVLAGRV
ncbi:MAG: flagellar protein FlgN [Desulfobacterales bacterium]|nr:flagellar protein FlgN [Desulfobacterales bacterium]